MHSQLLRQGSTSCSPVIAVIMPSARPALPAAVAAAAQRPCLTFMTYCCCGFKRSCCWHYQMPTGLLLCWAVVSDGWLLHGRAWSCGPAMQLVLLLLCCVNRRHRYANCCCTSFACAICEHKLWEGLQTRIHLMDGWLQLL